MSAIGCSLLASSARASEAFQDPNPYPGSQGPNPFPDSQGPSTYTLFAAEQLSYDDNLYRLPATANLGGAGGGGREPAGDHRYRLGSAPMCIGTTPIRT